MNILQAVSPKVARKVYAVELAVKLLDGGTPKRRIRGMIMQRLSMDRTTAGDVVNLALGFSVRRMVNFR